MISIIIPVYNGEDFIHRCLTSIFNQTYSGFQLIVINDGSKDNSLFELQKFKDKYNNHDFTIISTNNQGHGQARNLGMKHAKYEYIWFIDIDDYIYENNAIQSTMVDLLRYKPDIYVFSALETDFKKRNKIWYYTKQNKITTIKNDPFLFFKQNWSWNKIIRTDFIKNSGLKYNDHLMFEDVYLYVDLYQKAKSIYITRDVKYVYVKHNKSLTSSLKNFKGYHKALLYELKGFINVVYK